MKTIAARVALIALVMGAAGMVFTSTASAVHVLAEVTTPGQFLIGQTSPVQVTLRSADTSQPVAGAAVRFYTEGSFAGVTGEVNVGSAVTDENGVAVLEYEPRSASTHELRIEYLAPGASEPDVTVASIAVSGTAVQLSHSTSGIRIPGLNVWFIMLVISGVWALLFSVGWRVFTITQAGSVAEALPSSESAAKGTWI